MLAPPSRGGPDPSAALQALAASGVPALTGLPDGPPVTPPTAFASRMAGVTGRISKLTGDGGHRVELDWGRVLTGRAALLGLRRAATTSANGSCRLLRSADGWLALNLARPEDLGAVPALLAPAGVRPGRIDVEHPWPAVAEAAGRVHGRELLAQAVLLGIPAAILTVPSPTTGPCLVEARWPPAAPAGPAGLRVVDLSAMWAGPLATRILTAAGAAVTKVELGGRSDGTRRHPELYRWLHEADQEQIAIDTATSSGQAELRALLSDADVVVESSRPRALAQLGAGPDDLAARPGRVWLAISGHGRRAGANRVGFGDDAAVAGGLVGWESRGRPVFLADAVADPVTGMVAAAAVLEALRAGGGVLLDVSLCASAAWLAAGAPWGRPPATPVVGRRAGGGWELAAGGLRAPVADPVAAPPIPTSSIPTSPSRAERGSSRGAG